MQKQGHRFSRQIDGQRIEFECIHPGQTANGGPEGDTSRHWSCHAPAVFLVTLPDGRTEQLHVPDPCVAGDDVVALLWQHSGTVQSLMRKQERVMHLQAIQQAGLERRGRDSEDQG